MMISCSAKARIERLRRGRACRRNHRRSVSVEWVARLYPEARSYLDQNRATTIDQFDAAIKETQVGAVNVVYADKTTIAHRAAADIPDRGTPSRGMPWRIRSGDDPENAWTRGYLADWQMPHEREPSRGYIVTANNDPFGFTADGSVDNDLYYYGAFYASSMRAPESRPTCRARSALRERLPSI